MDFSVFVPRQVAKNKGIPNVTALPKENFFAAEIMEQVEYLFADANVANNDLLRRRMEDDPEGYVDIALLKKFTPLHAITDKEEYIAKAVKELSQSVEVNADGKRVRRKIPYFTLSDASRDDRVLYVERLSVQDYKISQIRDVIKSLFSAAGQVEDVYIPYAADGKLRFNGYAFVEFTTRNELATAIRLFGSGVRRAEDGNESDSRFAEDMRIMAKSRWLEKAKEYREYQKKEIESGCFKPLNQQPNGQTVVSAKKLHLEGENARGGKRNWNGRDVGERLTVTPAIVAGNDRMDTSWTSMPLEQTKPTHIRFDDSD